ncbi:hypothetical protein [Siphonobacter sp. BAB-5385]|uniref:hypothetical protein n=1 Tax=Siphonobacter sp. BAB-5385 TaxID=1864822 RepID=UPI00113FF6B0|nr:hypothetical protein [Siphonobacter sp. BAB-5385]
MFHLARTLRIIRLSVHHSPHKKLLLLLVLGTACTRHTSLPRSSPHNVVSQLNDSTWFATGKAIRLIKPGQQPGSVFTLQVFTDLDFSGNSSVNRSPAITGCNGECVPTQSLSVYQIPLKKGRYTIAQLHGQRVTDVERTNYRLLWNGSGLAKEYVNGKGRASWVRITRYDPESCTVEGQFSLDLNENLTIPNRLQNQLPPVARFRHGVFRVEVKDIRLKE